MPRESTRLIRPSKILDAEKFFIIASEGEVTERKYFNQLSDSDVFNREGKIEVCHIKRPSGDGNPIALRSLYEAIINAKEISIAGDKYPKSLVSDVYKIVERLVK